MLAAEAYAAKEQELIKRYVALEDRLAKDYAMREQEMIAWYKAEVAKVEARVKTPEDADSTRGAELHKRD